MSRVPHRLEHCLALSGLLLLLLLSACTQTQKEFYPDGGLKSEITMSGGKMNGPSVWYWNDGTKMMECTYVDDLLEGEVIRWYFNGNKQRTDQFQLGKKNGLSIIYDEGGNKTTEETYTNDTLNGLYKEFFPDGQVMVDGQFLKGLYNGIWTYYDQRGLIVGKGDFSNGSGILTGFFWNGKTKRIISFKNNQKNGMETWFFEDGRIEKEIQFEEGKILNVIQGDTTNISSHL
jgi:antitoxin component YwqK of YwqJK toxin-antitoxin module